MQPTALRSNDFTAPAVQGHMRPSNLQVAVVATEDEYYAWLGKVKTAVEKSIMNGWISWSAYLAEAHKAVIPQAAINALLSRFLDNAHSAAMIRHSMDRVKTAVQLLNPGQSPVLAADQTTVCSCQENTVDLASHSRRGPLHYHVWWCALVSCTGRASARGPGRPAAHGPGRAGPE